MGKVVCNVDDDERGLDSGVVEPDDQNPTASFLLASLLKRPPSVSVLLAQLRTSPLSSLRSLRESLPEAALEMRSSMHLLGPALCSDDPEVVAEAEFLVHAVQAPAAPEQNELMAHPDDEHIQDATTCPQSVSLLLTSLRSSPLSSLQSLRERLPEAAPEVRSSMHLLGPLLCSDDPDVVAEAEALMAAAQLAARAEQACDEPQDVEAALHSEQIPAAPGSSVSPQLSDRLVDEDTQSEPQSEPQTQIMGDDEHSNPVSLLLASLRSSPLSSLRALRQLLPGAELELRRNIHVLVPLLCGDDPDVVAEAEALVEMTQQPLTPELHASPLSCLDELSLLKGNLRKAGPTERSS